MDFVVNNLNLALDDGSSSFADLLAGLVEFNQLPQLLALVPVEALSAALRAQHNAVVIMQPVDVLAEFGLTQDETGEDDEAHKARLAKAAEWLADNRKHVEEAMTSAGFHTIEFGGTGPQLFKLGPMPDDENPFHPESPEGRAWANGDRSSIE